MNIDEISQQDYDDFIEVRDSGRTNMFNTTNVSFLSGLTKEQVRCIIANFDELTKKYGA